EQADLQSGNQEGTRLSACVSLPLPFIVSLSLSLSLSLASSVLCPVGWFNHGSRCFLYVDNPLGWNDAADHCKKMGADLASIHNPTENNFMQLLVQLGNNDAWIGAYYLQTKWRWIDGEGLYYSDWIGMSSASSNPCAYLRKNSKSVCGSVCQSGPAQQHQYDCL
uniref:C-type lectin domain-containing protein n=1 Tax=Gadus morhua TaxID=8049 RepID=A0A8C5F949_GADMO